MMAWGTGSVNASERWKKLERENDELRVRLNAALVEINVLQGDKAMLNTVAEDAQRESERLRTLLREILGTFSYLGSIGSIDNVVRSGWQDISRVERWTAAVVAANPQVRP